MNSGWALALLRKGKVTPEDLNEIEDYFACRDDLPVAAVAKANRLIEQVRLMRRQARAARAIYLSGTNREQVAESMYLCLEEGTENAEEDVAV